MSGWRKPAQDLRKTVKAGTEDILKQKIATYVNGGWRQVSKIRVVDGKPTVVMTLKNRKGA